jgi:dihydropteroate synthase
MPTTSLPPSSFWQTRRFRLDLRQPLVMGIVNTTPDSFSDGGRYLSSDAAKRHCDQLLAEGAHLLDIGGESTRPGARTPSPEEELARVLPVVQHAVGLGVPVSVDTSRPQVIEAVLAAGADVINDVRSLRLPGALALVAAAPDVGVCLMHMPAEPGVMQQDPRYDDVVQAVQADLWQRHDEVLGAGVASERVLLDPGIGFGKTPAHNLALLSRQKELLRLPRPLLLGWSRKSTLGALTGQPAAERVAISVAAALLAVERGAAVVRVHDVAATVQALSLWRAAPPAT